MFLVFTPNGVRDRVPNFDDPDYLRLEGLLSVNRHFRELLKRGELTEQEYLEVTRAAAAFHTLSKNGKLVLSAVLDSL